MTAENAPVMNKFHCALGDDREHSKAIEARNENHRGGDLNRSSRLLSDGKNVDVAHYVNPGGSDFCPVLMGPEGTCTREEKRFSRPKLISFH
jgi:hypothetical protein